MSDDIFIRTMTLKDYSAVKLFQRANLYNSEPLFMSSGEDPEKYNENDIDEYYRFLIGHDTSLIALQNEKVVGMVIAGTQLAEDIDKNYKKAEESGPHIWGRTFRFLSKLERDANIFQRYKVSKVLYSELTLVDKALRGHGLGSRLAARLEEVGREMGYPLLLAYCTSYYSARQKEALGWECAYALDYKDYKNAEGVAVFVPPAPHLQARVLIKKLV